MGRVETPQPLDGLAWGSDSEAYFQTDEAGERDPMGVAFGPPTLLFPAEGLPDEGGRRCATVPESRTGSVRSTA